MGWCHEHEHFFGIKLLFFNVSHLLTVVKCFKDEWCDGALVWGLTHSFHVYVGLSPFPIAADEGHRVASQGPLKIYLLGFGCMWLVYICIYIYIHMKTIVSAIMVYESHTDMIYFTWNMLYFKWLCYTILYFTMLYYTLLYYRMIQCYPHIKLECPPGFYWYDFKVERTPLSCLYLVGTQKRHGWSFNKWHPGRTLDECGSPASGMILEKQFTFPGKKFTFPGKNIYSPWKRNLGSSGPVVLWLFGPLVLWSCGPLVLWSSGPVVLWSCGPLVLWSSGPLVLWSSGPVVLWSFGPLVLWFSGPVVV